MDWWRHLSDNWTKNVSGRKHSCYSLWYVVVRGSSGLIPSQELSLDQGLDSFLQIRCFCWNLNWEKVSVMRSECAKNFLAFVIRLLLNDVCSFHNNTISSVLIFLLGCFQLKLADLDFEQLTTEFWLTDMSSCSARLRPSLDFLRICYWLMPKLRVLDEPLHRRLVWLLFLLSLAIQQC